MLKIERPIITFDVESTGTDPANDRIITLAAIKIVDRKQVPENWNWTFNPEMPIPPRSTEIHGITDEMVQDFHPFADSAERIQWLFDGCDLCGYNIRGFDIPILWEELNRVGIKWNLDGVRIIDGNEIFRRKETRTLTDAVRKYCEGDSHEDAHNASQDALASWRVVNGQLKFYPDLAEMSLDQLHEFCNTDEFEGMTSKRLDLAGHVIVTSDGVARYTARRVRGVPVYDDFGFGNWMLRNDFPLNTKMVLTKLFDDYRNPTNLELR